MKAPGQGAHLARALPALLLASAFVMSSGGTASAAEAPGGGATEAAWAQQARAFWTPARMKAARPVEIERPWALTPPGIKRDGSEVVVPHRVPAQAASGATASSQFGQVADPTAAQSRRNGVIFFSVGGFLGRCSGTSVNAPNRSVVVTAGHCANSGGRRGQWYGGPWVFVPGYRFGQRPFGVFPAKWLDTTERWRTTGSENFDVAAAVVGRNEHGERLGDAVGGTGIAWGLKADQVFDVHGYPVAPPFDGETQRLCAGTPFLGHDPESFLFEGPLNLAVDCNVTGGASGGGWTIHGDTLDSVTNYGYPDDPKTDFGAYFGKEVARLYGRAAKVR